MKAYNLGLYEKSMPNSLLINEKLLQAGLAGFDFLEISIDESDEKLARLKWGRAQKQDVILAMLSTGIQIRTMCLSGHRKYPIGSADEQTRIRGMEIMAEAIDLAADLGVRIIQLAGYDEYYNPSTEKTRQLFLENLIKCVKMAAKRGVILAFETMETDFMNTVEKAMKYVRIIDSPYLQIYPDLGNITNAATLYSRSVNEDLATGQGHLVAMHLKETLPGKFREIPFGTGHVNFEEGILTAFVAGVNLFVAEFWHSGHDDWFDQLENVNSFLRQKIENSTGKE